MILVIKILENSLHMSVIGAIETTKWRFLHLYFHNFTNVVQISVINPQIAKNYIILRRSAYLKMAYRLRTYISCFLEYVTNHRHRDLLEGMLCRPKSKQWPWSSNLWIPYDYSKIRLAQLDIKSVFFTFLLGRG